MGGPSATSGYRLNIKLPARGSVSSPAEAIIGSRPGGQAEQVAAGPTLNELRRKWRIRRFASIAAYDACGIAWHQMEGFYVRVTSSQKVTVVAELERVREQALQGFSEPDNRNLFREDGQLCGWPYPRSG